MAIRNFILVLFIGLLEGCQSDTTGKVTEAEKIINSFDTPPVAEDINLPNGTLVEDAEDIDLDWIYLDYEDQDGNLATSCHILDRSYVNVIAPCECLYGYCRVKVKGFENYYGPASFKYSVVTNDILSASALVQMNIYPQADAPLAIKTSFSMIKNTIYFSNGVSNPHLPGTDPDNLPELDPDNAQTILNQQHELSCIQVGDVSHGVVNVSSDCSFDYTPSFNFVGKDSFTFKVTDGDYNSQPVTVEITVTN